MGDAVIWRKSSQSGNGGADCVEVAVSRTRLQRGDLIDSLFEN